VIESRRLAVFVAIVVLAESAFYAVVPPLVPGFVRDVHLTTTEVGILVAAYPAGLLLAAIPSMALIDWRGVRTGTVVGLALLIVATLAFAWATAPLLLDLARLIQGVGGAVAWASALAWLTAESNPGRRASVIGGTLGAALIGMVIGPGIGAVASQVGRAPVFTTIAVVLCLVILAVPAHSPRSSPTRRSISAVAELFRNRQAFLGIGLLAGVGIVTGTVATLLPLLVSRRQGSAAVIAGILAASYLLGSVLNLGIGRFADRFGRLVPTMAGFALAAAILPTLPFWGGVVGLAGAAVMATGCVSSLWTPTAAMVSDGAEQGPAGQAVGVATLNAAWAAGAAVGAVAASSIAQAAGFPLPFALLGGLCMVCALIVLGRYRATPSPSLLVHRPGSGYDQGARNSG
jgi:MFS family permease